MWNNSNSKPKDKIKNEINSLCIRSNDQIHNTIETMTLDDKL